MRNMEETKMDFERQQITNSTDAQLRDRLKALRERYDPKNDGGCFPGGGYPMTQLRELHLITDELRDRAKKALDYDLSDDERYGDRDWVADNHVALDRATDVERYR